MCFMSCEAPTASRSEAASVARSLASVSLLSMAGCPGGTGDDRPGEPSHVPNGHAHVPAHDVDRDEAPMDSHDQAPDANALRAGRPPGAPRRAERRVTDG